MGSDDNRRTAKMRRKNAQRKKKNRLKVRADATRAERKAR
jgi:hypothetical protein